MDKSLNLVSRSLVEGAEGEIWSSKKIQFFDCCDCQRNYDASVFACAHYMAHAIHSSSLQFCAMKCCGEEEVFCLIITCKTIFIIKSFKTF